MSVIGDNIRALRQMRQLTQQQLADACGVTRETVNKWETGAISEVRASNVSAIMDAFGVTLDDLRSKTAGLQAQVRGEARIGGRAVHVPVLSPTEQVIGFAEVNASIIAAHPRAYAVEVPDDTMSRVLPADALAIVDPELGWAPNSIVLADAPPGCPSPVLRRICEDDDGLALVSDSYIRHEDHFEGEIDSYRIRGSVIWYQPRREL